eukprot:3682511-Prorocentrum_lima.AAC.1
MDGHAYGVVHSCAEHGGVRGVQLWVRRNLAASIQGVDISSPSLIVAKIKLNIMITIVVLHAPTRDTGPTKYKQFLMTVSKHVKQAAGQNHYPR